MGRAVSRRVARPSQAHSLSMIRGLRPIRMVVGGHDRIPRAQLWGGSSACFFSAHAGALSYGRVVRGGARTMTDGGRNRLNLWCWRCSRFPIGARKGRGYGKRRTEHAETDRSSEKKSPHTCPKSMSRPPVGLSTRGR